MVVKTLCKDGIPVNSILVDPDNLPLLAEGETLEDPQEVPYVGE